MVSRQRPAWRSSPNINAEENMNTSEEIATYRDNNGICYSPTLGRRTVVRSYDLPGKPSKKEKKWSLGSFFRRKKKNESDSSSEEDGQKKGFLRKKRKPEKRKKPTKLGTFDHVVISPARNSQIPIYNNIEDGVLSDPTNYSSYHNRLLPEIPTVATEKRSRAVQRDNSTNNEINSSSSVLGQGSVDNLTRRSRRELTKARVEARRGTAIHDSSSEDDSQRSYSSTRFRSDDSLTKQRDGSLSRRSRAARTERYIRRLSRDDENISRICSKSDIEGRSARRWNEACKRSPSRSPILPKYNASDQSVSPLHSSFSGLSTIPRSHNKLRISNSCKPANECINNAKNYLDVNDFPNGNYLDNQRSLSYDGNIHKSVYHERDPEIRVLTPLERRNERIEKRANDTRRQPPPPPPRDPRRLINVHYSENGRPTSYSFERGCCGNKSKSFNYPDSSSRLHEPHKTNSFHWNTNCRSTSEDNLPSQPIQNVKLPPRPSSTTPETDQRFVKRNFENAEQFRYLMDKSPRSRKPIFIQSNLQNGTSTQNASQRPLEFWKQKDQEELHRQQQHNVMKSGSSSPKMFTSQTVVRTKVFLPDNIESLSNYKKPDNNSPKINGYKKDNVDVSYLTPKNKTDDFNVSSNEELCNRKSKNLEEALNELEAIYNSLRLGDEDLLERAEQQELSAVAEQLKEKSANKSWKSSCGTVSDSSYSYDPLDDERVRKKGSHRRSRDADLKHDDMAYRKLNKERFATISDPQSVISSVSYLLTTPSYNDLEDSNVEQQKTRSKGKEPDITLDDVVYRNIKHANNTLKVIDPQPPFGIPLGPVSPAANSDYLHAVPETTTVKRHKEPDIVKDDLAFRNLRKDDNKEPALPPLTGEDFINNNTTKSDMNFMKKKRAVRSLSANISNFIQDRRKPFLNDEVDVSRHSSNQSLADIADAMEIARQVLKEKENRINATRRGFLSDTDASRTHLELNSPESTVSRKRHTFMNSMHHNTENRRDSNGNIQKVQIHSPLLTDSFLQAKPPRGLTPERKARSPTKESTPIPLSPLEERMLQHSEIRTTSFDDLLKELAREAKETSDRITNELNNLSDANISKKESTAKNDDQPFEVENKSSNDTDVKKHLSEIDAVSEHAKLCKKLLECVVDSTEAEVIVPIEEVQQTDFTEVIPESVANIVVSRYEDPKPEEVNVQAVISSDSEHDYENMISDQENDPNLHVTDVHASRDSKSPFDQNKEEIIAGFQELQAAEQENPLVEVHSETENKNREKTEGEESVAIIDRNAFDKHCVIACKLVNPDMQSTFVNTNHTSCLTNSFRNDVSCYDLQWKNFDSSLKSPRLVSKINSDNTRTDPICTSRENLQKDSNKGVTSKVFRGNNVQSVRDLGRTFDEPKEIRPWYCDPIIIAIACIYGVACAHQLASVDLVVVLGFVFAILSVIVALIL